MFKAVHRLKRQIEKEVKVGHAKGNESVAVFRSDQPKV